MAHEYIYSFSPTVTPTDRINLLRQHPLILWFTGLSGAGKSTIAHALEFKLFSEGRLTYTFDGDNVRKGLCENLGFSEIDRRENLRRIGHMIRLFCEAGVISLAAFISPLHQDRKRIRKILKNYTFIEIYVKCSLETCIKRDVKGLYKKAIRGEIENFTGISAQYDIPEYPDIIVDTDIYGINECVSIIYNNLQNYI